MWQVHNHIAQTEITVPLDPLESTAGHVNNASCWSSYCTNQTFSNTFKKARCPLFLGPCIITQTLQLEFKDLQGQMPESSVQWKHTNRTRSFFMPLFYWTNMFILVVRLILPLIGLVTIPVIPLTNPCGKRKITLQNK